ncbi:hypothetical protein GCM10023193_78030 [Planotetraspora kaengkrachanensis]|uniref:Uncharacterized protein n=1 Tax=Planotetraspora kaengkrachanensis TaxID=575193 RepID=A0A8J3Q139_9ACTN|nr:hypothetical protein Pka01_77180 [Planotetraspora kaengkrachanensis]
MHPEVEITQPVEVTAQLGDDASQPGPAGEKRLAAVEHDVHLIEAVPFDVFRHTAGRPGYRFIRNDFRTYLP